MREAYRSFSFRLVVNRCTWGLPQILEICLRICGDRDHSFCWIWFLLERPSAVTIREPGMCLALSITLLWWLLKPLLMCGLKQGWPACSCNWFWRIAGSDEAPWRVGVFFCLGPNPPVESKSKWAPHFTFETAPASSAINLLRVYWHWLVEDSSGSWMLMSNFAFLVLLVVVESFLFRSWFYPPSNQVLFVHLRKCPLK